MDPVRIALGVEVGGDRLVVIAGPCVIESEAHALFMAEAVREITARLGLPYVFKASFDKANRSALASYRGPGLDAGLKVLAKVKAEIGVPVLTDVHEPEQAAVVAAVVDVLQVPAFLCRQTDLLVACAETGKPVNVKKGQWMAPGDMKNAVAKIHSTGNRRCFLTERGVSFGYHNLVVDMRSLPLMRALGVPVCYDATHSLQSPGGLGDRSGGDRRFIRTLARSAVAAGVDALFIETHDRPDEALSDGPNSLPLAELQQLLEEVMAIDAIARKSPPPEP